MKITVEVRRVFRGKVHVYAESPDTTVTTFPSVRKETNRNTDLRREALFRYKSVKKIIKGLEGHKRRRLTVKE